MRNLAFLTVAALSLMALAGCNSNETTPAPTTPIDTQPAAPGAPGAPGAKAPTSQMGTGVEAAPPGVKTDLSGGLNGPKPK